MRLPIPEDLIIMKTIAHRPKDLLDIQAILDSHHDLDVAECVNESETLFSGI